MRELTVTYIFFKCKSSTASGNFSKLVLTIFFRKILMAAWNKAFLQARSFGCSFIMFFF